MAVVADVPVVRVRETARTPAPVLTIAPDRVTRLGPEVPEAVGKEAVLNADTMHEAMAVGGAALLQMAT